jgi:hypothetical protein
MMESGAEMEFWRLVRGLGAGFPFCIMVVLVVVVIVVLLVDEEVSLLE